MNRRRFAVCALLVALSIAPSAQQAKGGINSIQQEPLKEWLTYIASDELQGRATYSEGLGLAAGYISSHLAQWGVKPAGDNGTYLQVVKVLGIRTTSRATVTVEVNGQTRTFKDGEGITFPRSMGGKQTITGDQVLFAGYGLTLPSGDHNDYASIDPKGKIVIWLGPAGPKTSATGLFRLLNSAARNRAAADKGAIAIVGPVGAGFGGRGRGNAPQAAASEAPAATPAPGAAPQPAAAGRGRGAPPDDGDFTTVQRLDGKVTPSVTAQDEFFEFLFSGSELKYAELKQRATDQQPLPPFALKGVKMTINVDADYNVVRTRLTHNVVGIVEGTDPKLKDTYVLYGAHYDHTGYREGVATGRGGQPPANPEDRINNGADDDGSGTVAIMSIARAFALGPRPKRSILFVWHAGEESGLLGSRYNADFPVVPIEKMVAQINMDMVGRNRNNDPAQSNTVLVVGSDRISTELHNLNEDANASLPKPLTLDYEMNDPSDTESIYTRSDHYSYAAKGIPIIFFFTGLHPDYHMASDSVDKIIFDKIQRVAQLAYETGRRVANLDHMPVRDNKGPRVGKSVSGKLKTQ
ncbi:MAG TPA: M28 family peptidase [Vicinamibacterales bacterium]|jgi:hypothetical protein